MAPPWWTAAPFLLLLLAIALLPLLTPHFWESNLHRGLVAFACSVPTVVYLLAEGRAGIHLLLHALEEYAAFITLLGSLYTIAGGLLLADRFSAGPLTNVGFLVIGGILANFIGTTGASMVLIRPLLRLNRHRRRRTHVPIFFLFLVSNMSGLLTPLGDPPLFLGFLRGVPFTWTLRLWKQWLLANGIVLTLFIMWDTWLYRQEQADKVDESAKKEKHSLPWLRGKINLLLLAGVVACVLLQAWLIQQGLSPLWSSLGMVLLGWASLKLTPPGVHEENGFTWSPIIEVAVLFAGIFVTMAPALELLRAYGPSWNLSQAWQFFWLTGLLSSFLDNAPTYLTFATLASAPHEIAHLAQHNPKLLEAISCGAVFMGANTYIGNGPNFMVKAIAEENRYPMPSFFGYIFRYTLPILIPIYLILTLLLFTT
ncbi:MAG: sodium:proton antiporter [Gemmatales bacterium]|nr:sodium:proton antiporter [Gemmatales bacterium]MDW7994456.1 sodium:proton antiporter [Gemmatales bacterium]